MEPVTCLALLVKSALGWYAADFLGGVFHRVLDRAPIGESVIGRVARDFQRHHREPLRPLRTGWPALMGAPFFLLGLAERSPFLVAVGAGIGLTQVLHVAAHHPGRVTRALQAVGIALRPAVHAGHHRGDFDRDYCVLCGWANPLLNLLTRRAPCNPSY